MLGHSAARPSLTSITILLDPYLTGEENTVPKGCLSTYPSENDDATRWLFRSCQNAVDALFHASP
ncbi:hypothetical protein [Halocatena marina]|uniref:hypothetical protein n=1 Tax=Halocatena marina TaxID=2934937 RepID=UPI0036F44458